MISRAPRDSSQVRPGPLDQHEQPVAEADQEEDVDEEPGQPGEQPGELAAAEVARRPRRGRWWRAALVAVAERACGLAARRAADVARRRARPPASRPARRRAPACRPARSAPGRRRRRPRGGRGRSGRARPAPGRRGRAARPASAPAARPPRRRPEHRARGDPLAAERARPSASIAVTTRARCAPRRRAAQLRRGARRRVSAVGRQHARRRPRAGCTRACAGRWAEVAAQSVPRDLGERAGQLDAGRAGADDDERQPGLRALSGRLRARRPRRPAARGGGSPARRRCSSARAPPRPLVVAEVRVRRAGGDDQVVVGRVVRAVGQVHRRFAAGRSPSTSPSSTLDVLLPAQDAADRRRRCRRG